MNKVYFTKIKSKLGDLHLASSDTGLCKIGLPDEDHTALNSWLSRNFKVIEENYEKNESVAKQLIDYLEGNLKTFDVEIHLIGTPFQKKVWDVLSSVPYGEVCSYKDLAIRAKSPKGFRAVGMANNRNPIPIIIPCHRVIGSNGDLVGYGGGLDMKKCLLELEGRLIHKGKVVTK